MRCDEGKTRYRTHHDAVKMIIACNAKIARQGRNKPVPIRAYRCPLCDRWHVTKQQEREHVR